MIIQKLQFVCSYEDNFTLVCDTDKQIIVSDLLPASS